jgi:hypothetical protein
MTQYGWLDDFGAVCCWRDYPPAAGRPYITRKAPRKRAQVPTIETHGTALW